jgi:alpha-galactosidase
MSTTSSRFPDLLASPKAVFFAGNSDNYPRSAKARGPATWELDSTRLSLIQQPNGRVKIDVESAVELKEIILRWDVPFPAGSRFLGDAWERSYGDLEWRGATPHRLMPWYFLASNEQETAGYGVETGASALACWQVDATGVILRLDVRCGGNGVRLGSRTLHAATLVQRLPIEGETSFIAARALCAALCPKPLLPQEPCVGHNDWYWLYGKNSEALILEATSRFLELYPTDAKVRPWSVIDDGWQQPLNAPGLFCNGGPWREGNSLFPDMAALAQKIKSLGARPGIWMRPLKTREEVPDSWKIRCPKPNVEEGGYTLDPSVPEVLEQVGTDIARLRNWGYELIKHDFSTFDITSRWGFEMSRNAADFAPEGWSFADPTRTTAEIVTALFQTIRTAAGPDTLVIGCNTISHLSAGLFEAQRIGDDTSALNWDRTRRMGINTLAFRLPQHGTFYAADADCVPVSPHIPQRLTDQWLDLVARSGTPLFLSIDPKACPAPQKETIRRALSQAVHPLPPAQPLDWFDTAVPSHWKLQGEETVFDWSEWHAG